MPVMERKQLWPGIVSYVDDALMVVMVAVVSSNDSRRFIMISYIDYCMLCKGGDMLVVFGAVDIVCQQSKL